MFYDKINYGRGYVHSIQYHLVWCVKYRHDILIGQVDKDVKELLNLIAADNDVNIREVESHNDHIHIWGGHLWNPSYFVATVSENTEEQICQYIENQKKK